MKIDRETIQDYRYTLVMNGQEFSLLRTALFNVSVDEEYEKPFRNDCRAAYSEMVKTAPSVV